MAFFTFKEISESDTPNIRAASSAAFFAFPTPTVATGIPAGI